MQRIRKVRRITTPPNNKNTLNPTIQRKPRTANVTRTREKIKVNPDRINKHKTRGISNNTNKIISKVEPIWKGETVYIIGGGPSLKTFNWDALKGKKTIAINKAFYTYPSADILYFTDGRFYGWYKDDIDNFRGDIYTITPASQKLNERIKVLNRGGKLGLTKDRERLAHGNNSGYAAINLAYHLGCKRIVLLGYDMGNDGNKGHFHDGYPTNQISNHIYENNFIPSFESLYPLLKNEGIEIYNASEKSRLNAFPKISHTKALSFK